EPARVFAAEMFGPLGQRLLPAPLRLVARREHDERGVIAEGFNQTLGLFVEHQLHRRARTDLVPHSGFDLQVEAELVRRDVSRFGRCPGVEAYVVKPPALADAYDPTPRFNVRRRVAGQREVAAEVRAAQVGLAPVDDELAAFRLELAQAISHPPYILRLRQGY